VARSSQFHRDDTHFRKRLEKEEIEFESAVSSKKPISFWRRRNPKSLQTMLKMLWVT
jgi:hypothetical protein